MEDKEKTRGRGRKKRQWRKRKRKGGNGGGIGGKEVECTLLVATVVGRDVGGCRLCVHVPLGSRG